MAKNILIFSDGTGQAGGLTPDEQLTNVYKLFRATRCGPDTNIDPKEQLAFYDPGIGSPASGSEIKIGWMRWLYNIACQATGLGITRNIIDCYAAIIRLYQPGDRIYLFGFSRGAYTARCVGGVIGLCGIPTHMKDGGPLCRDAASAEAIASEAVRNVYQYGSSIEGDPLKATREALAAQFRVAYGADDHDQANIVPYFIGVWDTVAALKGSSLRLVGLGIAAVLLAGFGAWLAHSVAAAAHVNIGLWMWFSALLGLEIGALLIAYLVTHLNLPKAGSRALRLFGFQMSFYDTILNPRVPFARHAMSIDENRADFARVAWKPPLGTRYAADGKLHFVQLWFAGNHSDVGGSYPENESRLSDIALQWMVEEALKLPDPIKLNPAVLNRFPDPAGPQHDEVRAGIAGVPLFLQRFV